MTQELAQIVGEFLATEGSTGRVADASPAGTVVVQDGLLTHFVGLEKLGRAYFRAEPPMRRLWLERLLVALRPVPVAPRRELLARRLVPRLRTTLSVEQQRTERAIVEELHGMTAPDMLIAHRPAVGGLSAVLAFEMAEEAVDVAENHLKAWGVTFAQGFEQALATLRARSTEPLVEVSNGLWASTAADGLDAARLLLPELFVGLEVRGQPVAMVPHQEGLFVAGSEDDDALAQMAALALDLGQQPLGLSAQTFVLTAEGWQPWEPAADRPCAPSLRAALLPEQARGYDRQKALIEAQAEVDGVEQEVAPFVVLRDDDRQLVTATVWVEGTEPLLARASRIAFATRKGAEGDQLRAIALPWDEAAALPGVHLTRTDDTPERWRASGFPPFEALDASR